MVWGDSAPSSSLGSAELEKSVVPAGPLSVRGGEGPGARGALRRAVGAGSDPPL